MTLVIVQTEGREVAFIAYETQPDGDEPQFDPEEELAAEQARQERYDRDEEEDF